MIEVQHLTRQFGNFNAVQDVNVAVPAGITALLGPNGAGKTTLFNLIAGLDLPTRGSIRVSGLDPYHQHRQTALQLGVLPAQDGLLGHLGARVQLEVYARLFGMGSSEARARTKTCLEQVGLGEIDHRPVSQFSTGMRKRLAIARSLLHNPQMILLDEPTAGLDPAQVLSLRLLLLKCREEGRLVLFNTHHLSEVARIADRVMVMREGRLLFDDTREAFMDLAPAGMGELERMEWAYQHVIEAVPLSLQGQGTSRAHQA
ncbi:ABC transporter ATP-binding protein [Deinococcus cellulosilyticus]|uniref:ABC transporter domain-containing protein n=1 Tax=Deinococcus cellulosilyticus (strain DSM 18568 / NBRC 106333 / KACC 11606 / 5516J-15) TaxID=1223518 RepID=A0A511N947_DEIC1|nr:ABC transporter ATP-binding protein [Deinococcus cellulosilyticus]GEM49375.1 hypothetical protein DC3_50100 [Deinococcus cellulosilyticus NBRC 106333 = KACC 11606]